MYSEISSSGKHTLKWLPNYEDEMVSLWDLFIWPINLAEYRILGGKLFFKHCAFVFELPVMLLNSLKLSQFLSSGMWPVYSLSRSHSVSVSLSMYLGSFYTQDAEFLDDGSSCVYFYPWPYLLCQFFPFRSICPLILNIFFNYVFDGFFFASVFIFWSTSDLAFWCAELLFSFSYFPVSLLFKATFWKTSWNMSPNPTIKVFICAVI